MILGFDKYKMGWTTDPRHPFFQMLPSRIIIWRFERYKTGLTTDPSHPFCWSPNQETLVSTAAFCLSRDFVGESPSSSQSHYFTPSNAHAHLFNVWSCVLDAHPFSGKWGLLTQHFCWSNSPTGHQIEEALFWGAILTWALLGYAPQRLCPGVNSSLCEECESRSPALRMSVPLRLEW